MTAMQPFRFDDQYTVRVLGTPDAPRFVAADVAAALGLGRTHDMVRGLDDDEKGADTIRTPSGDQEMTTISESGLYSAILRSRVERAKTFKRWITHEVLPQIRRTGSFAQQTAIPRTYAEALRAAADEYDRAEREHAARVEAESQVRELAIPAGAWKNMVSSDGDYMVRDAAKVLSRDAAIEIGERRLFAFMQAEGWIFRENGSWKPYQTQIQTGRLAEKLNRPYLNERTGEYQVPAPSIRVTPKGLAELHKRLGGAGPLPLIASA